VKTTPDGRFIAQFHPTIIQGQANKFYAVSGGVWVEVPDNTTLEDAKELFCWGDEARKYWDSNHSDDVKTIEVKGSKGQTYKVTKTGPSWNCECRGFAYRRDCKHIQNLKILIGA
jgi:hypothetical protein